MSYTKFTQVKTVTAREIERAVAGQVITEEKSPGLRMHVGAGTRTWIYRYTGAQGKLRQVNLGHYPAVSIINARLKWAQARERRSVGGDPATESREARRAAAVASTPRVTVGDIVRSYFNDHITKNRNPTGANDIRLLFEARVYPVIGDTPCADFDMPAAAAYLKSQIVTSESAGRKLRAELRAAWRDALEVGRIREANPFVDLMKGKLNQRRRKRYLPDNELRAFLAWLPDSGMSRDVQDALRLTLYTAARSGEVVAVQWTDLDMKSGAWTLPKTKTDEPRTVRLPKQALAVFKARRADVAVGEAYVFPSPIEGQHISQPAVVWAVHEYRDTLKIPSWTAHDLRRSARTGLARLGVSREVAEAAIGHTKGGEEGTYNLHEYEREVGEALAKWCNHLDQIAAPGGVVKLRSRHAQPTQT